MDASGHKNQEESEFKKTENLMICDDDSDSDERDDTMTEKEEAVKFGKSFEVKFGKQFEVNFVSETTNELELLEYTEEMAISQVQETEFAIASIISVDVRNDQIVQKNETEKNINLNQQNPDTNVKLGPLVATDLEIEDKIIVEEEYNIKTTNNSDNSDEVKNGIENSIITQYCEYKTKSFFNKYLKNNQISTVSGCNSASTLNGDRSSITTQFTTTLSFQKTNELRLYSNPLIQATNTQNFENQSLSETNNFSNNLMVINRQLANTILIPNSQQQTDSSSSIICDGSGLGRYSNPIGPSLNSRSSFPSNSSFSENTLQNNNNSNVNYITHDQCGLIIAHILYKYSSFIENTKFDFFEDYSKFLTQEEVGEEIQYYNNRFKQRLLSQTGNSIIEKLSAVYVRNLNLPILFERIKLTLEVYYKKQVPANYVLETMYTLMKHVINDIKTEFLVIFWNHLHTEYDSKYNVHTSNNNNAVFTFDQRQQLCQQIHQFNMIVDRQRQIIEEQQLQQQQQEQLLREQQQLRTEIVKNNDDIQGQDKCICGKIARYICSCTNVIYCSIECQDNDWENHKIIHEQNI